MTMHRYGFVLLLVAATTGRRLHAEQSDTAVASDSLPAIELIEREFTVPGGGSSMGADGMMYHHPDASWKTYRYAIQGVGNRGSIGFLGLKLRHDVREVPRAKRKMTTYAVLRGLTPVLMIGGISWAIVSLSDQMSDDRRDEEGNLPPPELTGVGIGVGIALLAWIPRIASKGIVPRAVNAYNAGREPAVRQ